MNWNHRIMRYPNGELGIHEVYYFGDGEPMWTVDASAVYGEDKQDLALEHKLMAQAFDHPIMDYELGETQDLKYLWE